MVKEIIIGIVIFVITAGLITFLTKRIIFLVKNMKGYFKIKKHLLANEYLLLCNPNTKMQKTITFKENRTIGKGQNKNEHFWKLRFSFIKGIVLETIQNDGGIHNRFDYDLKEKKFVCTNDEDLNGYIGQTLARKYQNYSKNKEDSLTHQQKSILGDFYSRNVRCVNIEFDNGSIKVGIPFKILDKNTFKKDVNKLVMSGYLSRTPLGYSLTDKGYNYVTDDN